MFESEWQNGGPFVCSSLADRLKTMRKRPADRQLCPQLADSGPLAFCYQG